MQAQSAAIGSVGAPAILPSWLDTEPIGHAASPRSDIFQAWLDLGLRLRKYVRASVQDWFCFVHSYH